MNIIEQLIRIDHRNKINNFDAKTILMLKEKLYSYLEDLGEINPTDTIKYFEKVICNISDSDSFIASNFITKKLISINKTNLINEAKIPEILDFINTKAIKNNTLELNENTILQISKVLVKFFNDARVKYHISTGQDFIKKLNGRESDYEIIPQTRSSSFVDMVNESFQYISQNSNNNTKSGKQRFPGYILDMKEYFQFIKAVNIFVPKTNDIDLAYFVLVYLNIHWLFPNILEVSINLDNNKLLAKRTNFQSNMDNKQSYEIIMLIPFFINHLQSTHSLKVILTDSYQAELDFLLKSEKILSNGFHILDLINNMYCLTSFDMAFNALDSNTFKRVLVLIHTNNNLRSLSLNFFPNDEYFTADNILRFSTLYDFNLNKRNSFTIVDENEYIMDNLVTYFELNLEFLLIILMSKIHNLNTLKIHCEIPTILFQNDKYMSCIYKFTLNLFKLLEQSNNQMQNFEFHSANFTLNGKTHSSLNKFLECVQINKNETISNYFLNTRFYKVTNLMNLLPRNVECLTIAELDNDTLRTLSTGFKNRLFKNLKIINICVSPIYFDIKKFDDIFDFFQAPKSKQLKEIHFTCKNRLQDTTLGKLLDIMRNDNIPHYELNLGKYNKIHFNNSNDFYYEFNTKMFSIALIFYIKVKKPKNILVKINQYLKRRKHKTINLNIIE
jgi:hypothetical protein